MSRDWFGSVFIVHFDISNMFAEMVATKPHFHFSNLAIIFRRLVFINHVAPPSIII